MAVVFLGGTTHEDGDGVGAEAQQPPADPFDFDLASDDDDDDNVDDVPPAIPEPEPIPPYVHMLVWFSLNVMSMRMECVFSGHSLYCMCIEVAFDVCLLVHVHSTHFGCVMNAHWIIGCALKLFLMHFRCLFHVHCCFKMLYMLFERDLNGFWIVP